ncbi:hypothetical protein L208DRAFT_1259131, partial [Tricholoma matsutake]
QRYGRSPVGNSADLVNPFICGEWYSLVAAMSVTGYLATCVVPGSLNSFAFFDFIVDDVLPQMKTYPDNHSVLIMDNC